jgi:hypothetical protein
LLNTRCRESRKIIMSDALSTSDIVGSTKVAPLSRRGFKTCKVLG